VNQRCFKLLTDISLVELLRGAFKQSGANSAIVAAIGVSSMLMSKSSSMSHEGICAPNSEFQEETARAGRKVSEGRIAPFEKVASVEAREPFSSDFESDEAEVLVA
jgi:hypothetical protein